MKRFISLIVAIALATPAGAQQSSRVVEGGVFPNAQVAKNFIKNGEFETTGKLGVIDTSSIATVVTPSVPISGKKALQINATASGQIVRFDADNLTADASGSCKATFRYRGDGSLYKAYVVTGTDTRVSREVTLRNSSMSTGNSNDSIQPDDGDLTFTCTAGTSYDVAIESTGDGAAIEVDSVESGKNVSVVAVQQATAVGKISFIGCSHVTNSTTAVDVSLTGCTPAVTGNVAVTSSGVFSIKDLSPSPSTYEASFQLTSQITVAGVNCTYSVVDLNTGSIVAQATHGPTVNSFGSPSLVASSAFLSGTHGYKLQVTSSSAGGNCVTTAPIVVLKKIPSQAQAVRNAATEAISGKWFHGNDCSFSTSSTTFTTLSGDSTCTFGEISNKGFGAVTSYTSGPNKLPGIVFTPPRSGRLNICARFASYKGASAQNAYFRLTDAVSVTFGSAMYTSFGNQFVSQVSICGQREVTPSAAITFNLPGANGAGDLWISSLSSGDNAIEWEMYYIDQGLPAPVTEPIVVSKSAYVSNTGVVSDEYDGDWINGSCAISDTSLFSCTINGGVFSAKPNCSVSILDANANGTDTKQAQFVTGGVSNTLLTIRTNARSNGGGLKSAEGFMLICMGPR